MSLVWVVLSLLAMLYTVGLLAMLPGQVVTDPCANVRRAFVMTTIYYAVVLALAVYVLLSAIGY